MASTLRPGKVQIPYTTGVIQRSRLLNELKSALTHKITLISAPPGYGKTTIAAQFARDCPYPVVWHTVEERQRDLPNLFNECLAAFQDVIPEIQNLTPAPGSSANELAAQIADFLRDSVSGDIIYVLDDVHHMGGSPAAEAWLRTLVALVPPNCHLILISRMLPDLPLTEMIARREVVAMGQELLRFTVDEIRDLAQETPGVQLSVDEIQDLASRLEGWPAGTVLALHPLPAELERMMLRGGVGPEALFNTLASVMLRAQPPGLRDFLLYSSTLSRVTPALCSTALQLPDSGYWLAEAQARNLFLSRVTGGLVYHKLFRTFLQSQLKDDDPDLFVDLHARAARWFEENNQLDEAFDHYVEAELYVRAATIAERVAQVYFAQGRAEVLLNWGEQLREADALVPRLLYNCARVHTDRYDYAVAETELERAEHAFRAYNEQAGLIDVQLQRAMLNFQKGDYHLAITLATSLAQIDTDFSNSRGRALKILGVAQLRLGDIELAIQYLEEALPLYRADGDGYALANLLQDLGVAYARLGHLDDASACLQEVVALRRALSSSGALALAFNNLGYYYHRNGNYERAMAAFQEGFGIVARVLNKRAEGYLLWSIGDLQRDRGAFDEALQLYNKALELIGGSEPSLRCSILISTSVLGRWQGKLKEAVSLADKAQTIARARRLALENATAQAVGWAARAEIGEAAEALDKLETIVGDLRKQNILFEWVQTLGLSAHAALLCADPLAADNFLMPAQQVALDGGSVQPLIAEIMHTPLLRSYLEDNSSKYGALLRDLDRLQQSQVKPTYVPRKRGKPIIPTTYSVRVTTFGEISVERDGEPVPASEWRATTARELFLYLLFKGPTRREDISLLFWPDGSTQKVRSNYHTSLYRARQALGEDVLIFKDNLYRVSHEVDIWCDAHELEVLTRQARLLSPRDARTEDLWRNAVNLYKGEFLPPLDAEWVIAKREVLEEAYLDALMGLGECARARGDLRDTLSAYKRALDIDPYREDIHRAIMTCYAEKGDKKKVITHLHELQELLQEELALEPSTETIALVQNLLN